MCSFTQEDNGLAGSYWKTFQKITLELLSALQFNPLILLSPPVFSSPFTPIASALSQPLLFSSFYYSSGFFRGRLMCDERAGEEELSKLQWYH